MIKYEIEGGNLPVVICYPEVYRTFGNYSESSAQTEGAPYPPAPTQKII